MIKDRFLLKMSSIGSFIIINTFYSVTELRSLTSNFHLCLSCAVVASSPHVSPLSAISLSTHLLQVSLGRFLLLDPWGFHLRACLAMHLAGFLRVCPIQRHFLLAICCLIGACAALSHSSSIVTMSYNLIFRMILRHLLSVPPKSLATPPPPLLYY